MKKITKILLAAFFANSCIMANASTTEASATAVASVNIMEVIRLTKVTDLNFGRLISGNPGSVVLTTTGTRSAVGATVVGESGWNPARFEVRGSNDFDYFITLPTNLILKNGDGELRVDNIVAKPSTSVSDSNIGTVKSDSFFTVGGRLVVPDEEIPNGTYSTSFDVSIGYN